MKSAYYEMLGSTLAILDVSRNVLGSGYVICRINVPYRFRSQGIGRRIMASALADADAEGVDLWLDINPYGEMTYEQLEAWYVRCGFVKQDSGRYLRKSTENLLG
jgi:hypothetical protein